MASPLIKPVRPASRLVQAMSGRLFICVCGFVPPSIAHQKKHRKVCPEWKDRPDPRGLRISRWHESWKRGSERTLHCEVCARPVDHHMPSCPYSFSETARREAVIRAGLSPNEFYLFLLALRKRYPSGFTG